MYPNSARNAFRSQKDLFRHNRLPSFRVKDLVLKHAIRYAILVYLFHEHCRLIGTLLISDQDVICCTYQLSHSYFIIIYQPNPQWRS